MAIVRSKTSPKPRPKSKAGARDEFSGLDLTESLRKIMSGS